MESITELKLVVWLLILSYPINLVSALCERTWCRPYPTSRKDLEVKCPSRRSQMFYVDVNCAATSNDVCTGSVTCSGLQQDVLRAVAEDCYWKRKCKIPMNRESPLVLNMQGTCTSITPDVMEARAFCVKKNKIFSFNSMRPSLDKSEGVIRISETFPWNYFTNVPRRRMTLLTQPGKKLRLSFLEADIDEMDTLSLTSGHLVRNVTVENRNGNFDFSQGDVTLQLDIASSSRSGKGFVLCFSWLDVSSEDQRHACDLMEGICDRSCRSYPTPQKFLEFKCKKTKDAMFYVDVRSSSTVNGNCSGSVQCSGLQQEVLRAVTEECYWNPRCYITMNNTIPNILNIYGMCLNVHPHVIEARALCIKKKKISSFYRIGAPIRDREGVITISENFPWDYFTNSSIHRITFKAKSRKKLRISFLEADLDRESDYLKLRNVSSEVNITEVNKGDNFDSLDGDVTLEFAVATTSRRGKGFVLCFLWLGRRSTKQQHACDLVRGVKCLPGKTQARKRPQRRSQGNSSA